MLCVTTVCLFTDSRTDLRSVRANDSWNRPLPSRWSSWQYPCHERWLYRPLGLWTVQTVNWPSATSSCTTHRCSQQVCTARLVLLNFSSMESSDFDFFFPHSWQVTWSQWVAEMTGFVCGKLITLSGIRSGYQQLVVSPECPCSHSSFRPR